MDVVQRPGVQDEHADAYAQVAGDLLLEGIAAAALFSGSWFRTDISERFGWLFEPACLEYDGWVLVELQGRDNRTYGSWTRPAGSSY